MLQFGASLTYDTSSVNYDHNMFIIQATGQHIKSQSNYWRRGFTIYTADPALHNIMSLLAPKAII